MFNSRQADSASMSPLGSDRHIARAEPALPLRGSQSPPGLRLHIVTFLPSAQHNPASLPSRKRREPTPTSRPHLSADITPTNDPYLHKRKTAIGQYPWRIKIARRSHPCGSLDRNAGEGLPLRLSPKTKTRREPPNRGCRASTCPKAYSAQDTTPLAL